jgi:hypothetical protein
VGIVEEVDEDPNVQLASVFDIVGVMDQGELDVAGVLDLDTESELVGIVEEE